jgi:hypothetical protein
MKATSMRTAEEILSKFPGPVYLGPDIARWTAVLFGSTGFALLGFLSAQLGFRLDGWLLSAVFCSVALRALYALCGFALTLDQDGFEVRWGVHRAYYEWRVCTDFSPERFSSLRSYVVFNGGVLPDSFGFSPVVLAALMNRWRDRAIRPDKSR